MAHLSLSLLGPFQVTLDGQPVTGFKSNKIRALLAYLAVEADRTHRREVLAGLLWPDWPDRDALSNLRYALSNLRRVIGDRQAEPPFLLVTRDTLQFNTASDCWLDVAAFTDPTGLGDLSGLENEAEAEASLHKAIEVARRQRAKSWELRAVITLSRLWQRQGKKAEAHQMLAEIYNWFTEGFDTADLIEAKTLLEALA